MLDKLKLPRVVPCAGGDRTPAAGGVISSSSPEQYLILSIDGAEKGDRRAEFLGWCLTHDVGVKALQGAYKGTKEWSFIINARDWQKVYDRGFCKGQESILHLGPSYERTIHGWRRCARMATLYYRDGHVEVLGRFVGCSKAYALKQDAWTYDPADNQYYVAI